jgi:hypothetical protein
MDLDLLRNDLIQRRHLKGFKEQTECKHHDQEIAFEWQVELEPGLRIALLQLFYGVGIKVSFPANAYFSRHAIFFGSSFSATLRSAYFST